MPGNTLEVTDLTAGYATTRVIEGISLQIPEGKRLAVLGRNGVGKTTLLASIVGLTQVQRGAVKIGERDVSRANPSARARHGLGYVPQTRDVFRSLTVEENLFAGLKGRPRHAVTEAYELFGHLANRRTHLASQLSGGEQQMLSIARSILGQPTVLLLDEPLEGLAPVVCDQLMDALTRLNSERQITMLIVEQQIERALAFAETAIVLDRGRVVWSGHAPQLLAQPQLLERYLGVGAIH